MMDATVRTPPTMAHVLYVVSELLILEQLEGDSRCKEMGKGLGLLEMHNLNGRDLVVEESTWEAADSMLDVDPSSVAIHALSEISLEVSGTVLVGVDLLDNEIPESR